MTSPTEPPPPDERPDKPLPLQLELPAEKPAPAVAQGEAAAHEASRGAAGRGRRWVVRGGATLLVLGAATAVVVAYVLPWYVRRQCIAEAAAHGIALSVDEASIDTSGFRLVGVRAAAVDVPGAKAQAPEIEVETSGLRPQKMTVRGAELTLEGRATTVDAALAKWRASPGGGQGGAWTPQELVVDGSRVVWTAPVGDNGRVEAADVHLEVAWRSGGNELHARSDKVTLVVPGGTLGPWRLDVDRAPGTSRVRVALDPAVPEACTVLVVGDDERTTSVDVVVPRSPLAHLGVPPGLLGLNGKDLQVAANFHYDAQGPSRAEASAKGGLYGIEASGIPRPFDVSWDGTASGDPVAGLDVKKARLAVGPLVGTLTGTLKRFDDGFRLDLAWSAAAVPCAAFDTPLPEGQPFDIAYQLRQLARATGLTKVSGDVSARGSLAFDSRDLGATRVDFAPEARCQVALFAP